MRWRFFHNYRKTVSRDTVSRTRPLLQLLVLSCCFATSLSARADLVQAINITIPGTDFHNDAYWSLGYEFYLTEDVSLRALGYYDANADGFEENHPVGLWNLSGELLASTIVTTDSQLDGWFRWENIAALDLQAYTRYVIAGLGSVDDYMWDPAGVEVDARFQMNCARYRFGEDLDLPDQCASETFGFFGPNLLIAPSEGNTPLPVSLPATGWLLMAGGIAASILARYRRKLTDGFKPALCLTLPLLISALFVPASNALDLTVQPVQGPTGWAGQQPLGNRYQRYSHEYVGAILAYDNVFDDQGNYIVPVGESLRWVWLRDNRQLAAKQFTYVGGASHCWVSQNGSQQCQTFEKLLAVQRLRCEPDDKPFSLIVFRNDQEVLRQNFDSERFKIKSDPIRWSIPRLFAVKRSSGQTGLDTQELSFIVEDDLNCGRRLADVEVELQTTILPGSNGHGHFSSGDRGTGTFSAKSGFPIEPSEENTKAKGKTNNNGQFQIRYSAQDFALTEKVKLIFKRPAKDDHPERRLEASLIWDIQLLAPEYRTPDNLLEPVIAPHTWDNGLGCIHNPAPRYMTPSAAAMLPWAFNEYAERAGGATLRANDASLPWGGKIDLHGADRAGCHKGHREGIAIDINGTDSQNRDIWAESYGGNKLFEILKESMRQNGFKIFKEKDSIHYDFSPEPIEP